MHVDLIGQDKPIVNEGRKTYFQGEELCSHMTGMLMWKRGIAGNRTDVCSRGNGPTL